MKTFTDLAAARDAFDLDGGCLLDLGSETECVINKRTGAAVGERHTGRTVYAVCDTDEARDMGRDLAKLEARGWDETAA